MKIVSIPGVVTLTVLAALAGPLAAQGSQQGQSAARPATTLHKQVEAKGSNGDDDAAQTPAQPEGAKANEARTNSPAATSGQINGRNALAPAGQAQGPSGAPQVGTGR